jgi:hypothetical protein
MPNIKKIHFFENSITRNKKTIAKRKKSIPLFVLACVLLYVVLFNLSGYKIDLFFDNQLHFIQTLTFTFISILIFYFAYVFYSISKLSKQSKDWNKSIYKLSKLDEGSISSL